MELTHYQNKVGSVLARGATLITAGDLTAEQEQEVSKQVEVLNKQWEELRVGTMERQTRYARYLVSSIICIQGVFIEINFALVSMLKSGFIFVVESTPPEISARQVSLINSL